MAKHPFIGISIHSSIYHTINSHIDNICGIRYKSITEFIEDSVQEKLQKCGIPIMYIPDADEVRYKISKIFNPLEPAEIPHIGDDEYYTTDNGKTLIMVKYIFNERWKDFYQIAASNKFNKIIIISPSFNKKIIYKLENLSRTLKITIEWMNFEYLNEEIKNTLENPGKK
ncbi:MAG: hypothetical protein QW292_09330 [Candidatus Parvarchaeota archaeon]